MGTGQRKWRISGAPVFGEGGRGVDGENREATELSEQKGKWPHFIHCWIFFSTTSIKVFDNPTCGERTIFSIILIEVLKTFPIQSYKVLSYLE